MNIADYTKRYLGMEEQEEGSLLKRRRMEGNYLTTKRNNSISFICNSNTSTTNQLLQMDAYQQGNESLENIITQLPVDKHSKKAKRLAAILC